MSVVALRSEDKPPGSAGRADAPMGVGRLRAVAGVSATFAALDGRSALADLSEHGGYRLKFPDVAGRPPEAVVVNTGGGVAAGDHLAMSFAVGRGASATVSSATAERIYRSTGAVTEISIALDIAAGATLAWLPQATILFSGARLTRRLEATIGEGSRLLLAETTVLGRIASGEVMGEGLYRDNWRIWRSGRLVYAEAGRLDGDIGALTARPAITDGERIVALLVCFGPDIEERTERTRAALDLPGVDSGVSAWNGMLVARALAVRLDRMQFALRRAIDALEIAPVPHVWSG